MSIIEQIMAALLLSTPGDLRAIRQYIGWMRFRRRVNDTFYPTVHWIRPSHYHWIR